MDTEQEIVRPLDSAEIKDIIAMTIAVKVRESLDTTCWLFGNAWPKFKADWKIDIMLENFGLEQPTTVNGKLLTHQAASPEAQLVGGDLVDPVVAHAAGEIPYTPPNVIRKQHGLPVPTMVRRDDGGEEQKAVMFRRTPPKPGIKPRGEE